jgi:hypothetical protein
MLFRAGMYGLVDRSARHELDEHRCPISAHLRRGGCSCFTIVSSGIDLASTLDLLLLERGAVAGPGMDNGGSGFLSARMQSYWADWA